MRVAIQTLAFLRRKYSSWCFSAEVKHWLLNFSHLAPTLSRLWNFALKLTVRKLESYLALFRRYGHLLAKNCLFFLSLSHSAPPLPMFPLEFRAEVNHEVRVMGLSSSEDPMIVAWVILTQCQRVTDRRTDRHTDGYTIASTALCIASYAAVKNVTYIAVRETTLCLKKRDPDIIDCNFKKDWRIFTIFLHKHSWHSWPSNGSSSSHLTQHLFLHYLGKTEQTKYALKWTTNVNKLEIGSHKILITAVWAHEVYCLLTYCSTSCYQTCHWWHVRVSAVQRTSASAREAMELLECETSDFISPDLWSPKALTSNRSITSSGGHATAGLSDYVQECGWTREATGWNLDWSGAEHYWHCYQQWRKRLHACARRRADISNIYCRQLNNWTIG